MEDLGFVPPLTDSSNTGADNAGSQLSFGSIFSDSPIGPTVNDQTTSDTSTPPAPFESGTQTKPLRADTSATANLGDLTILDDYGLALTEDNDAGLGRSQEGTSPQGAASASPEPGFLTFSDPFAGFNSATGFLDDGPSTKG